MTLNEYPTAVKRALATHASLLRCKIQPGEIFVGPAKNNTDRKPVLAVFVKRGGKVRATFNMGPWDVDE